MFMLERFDGKKNYEQKHYLLWNLRDLHDIANGTDVVAESFVSCFSRFRNGPCLCEICENVVLFITGLNKKLAKEKRLPTNPHDLVNKFSCNSIKECMNSECEACFKTGLTEQDFVSSNANSSNESSSSSSDESVSNDYVKFKEWGRDEDGKLKKLDRFV